ncbi:hypothetical protein DID96_35635, partial [Burkholderia sp. Bp8963]|uniref:formylglycine-generating enzyme family protein n=1 Tax=Burkholderia sp. Bp8963 TaxID=2184547 RepID=UPI000FC281B7
RSQFLSFFIRQLHWRCMSASAHPDMITEAVIYSIYLRDVVLVYPTDTGSLDKDRNVHGRKDGPSELMPVGSYPPNPLGLYEMGENAMSWVNDWYDPEYYQHSPVNNPRGPESGTKKVMRGADFASDPEITAMTMLRFPENPVQKDYYPRFSYRCSIQQAGPLKK